MNIFVGNLSFDATGGDVKKLFEDFGSVASVRIVMEKKRVKSRGFGFVQMPDGQLALTAIAALNGKEFMGRPLNVSPARPKPKAEPDKGEAKKIPPKIKVKGQKHSRHESHQKDAWYSPVFNKKRGRYKTGRRLRSFMKRQAASGITLEATPKRENRENPLRWRKNYGQPKPWQKSHGEPRPWKKTEPEFKPWRKSMEESKPRRKSKRPRPRQSQIESRRKPGGYTR